MGPLSAVLLMDWRLPYQPGMAQAAASATAAEKQAAFSFQDWRRPAV